MAFLIRNRCLYDKQDAVTSLRSPYKEKLYFIGKIVNQTSKKPRKGAFSFDQNSAILFTALFLDF